MVGAVTLVVKLLSDFLCFNVILDIHEEQVHLMPHKDGWNKIYSCSWGFSLDTITDRYSSILIRIYVIYVIIPTG